MKIIYFTTAQSNKDFNLSLRKWIVAPNLSNQNFHNKLIRALSSENSVYVISLRPINKNYTEQLIEEGNRVENNVIWNYPKVKNSKVDKLLNTRRRINQLLHDFISKDDVILVDTLNSVLLNEAIYHAKKNKVRVFGICTDNPTNISFASKIRTSATFSKAKKLDGYIVLTDKLGEIYNPKKKPQVKIDGVIEELSPEAKQNTFKGDFIFFGGCLMRKYGVYNLIEAYKQLDKKDLKLVLCGHHKESDLEATIEGYQNIHFLGALNYDQVRSFEEDALVCVNPRPIDEKIDLYSIPSKTLEYLASGSLTITTRNPLLQERYNDAIIWSESGEVEDIKKALEIAINMSHKERKEKISLSKELINQYASFEAVAKKIKELF